jgi:hypothetical protein
VDAVAGGEALLAALGGPAELAAGAAGELPGQHGLPGAAQGVARAQPDKVEDFVPEDAAEFARADEQGGVEYDPAEAQEGSGVDFGAARDAREQSPAHRAQFRSESQADRPAAERGGAAEQRSGQRRGYFFSGVEEGLVPAGSAGPDLGGAGYCSNFRPSDSSWMTISFIVLVYH